MRLINLDSMRVATFDELLYLCMNTLVSEPVNWLQYQPMMVFTGGLSRCENGCKWKKINFI